MSNKTVKTIYTVYGIVTSALLIISGILLMIACVQVYNIGDRPFTVENIRNAFSKICIPVYITIGAVIIGIVLWLVAPITKGKAKADIDKKIVLSRLEKKLNISTCSPEMLDAINKEKAFRRVLRIIAVAVGVAASTPAILYALNLKNFGEDYNQAVISACMWILPAFAIVVGISIAFIYLEKASVERQINTIKVAIAANGTVASNEENAPCKCRRNATIRMSARLVVLALAVIFIILGILNGGMNDVLSKAINICTECIGLG